MKEQVEEKQNLEISDVISNTEAFLQKNSKIIIGVLIAVVVIVLGYFGIKKFYFEPRAEEAAEEMFMAENYFAAGDFEKALNGDSESGMLGFVDIISDYGCTKSANLAHYYAGLCEMRLGNFSDALDHFKSYKGKDSFTKATAIMLQGDAETEQGNNDNAIKLYIKAAKVGDNFIVAPTALFKAAMLYIAAGNNSDAIQCLEQIKEKYPESTESMEADKYIAYAENVKW